MVCHTQKEYVVKLLLKMCSLEVGEMAQWVGVLAVTATGLELKFQILV